jgi:tRNA dimethylallyltransferase
VPVLVVGGTALYIRALLEGLFSAPPIPPELHERLRMMLHEQGSMALHQRLRQVDPASAERLHPNDGQRVLRALEVFEACGRPMSELWAEQRTQRGTMCVHCSF